METYNDQESSDNAESSWSYNDATNLCHETNSCIRIEATYKVDTRRFRLPLDHGFFELKQELATRFELELDSFGIKCLDDDHEWTCDDDMQEFANISRKPCNNILHLMVTDREIFQGLDGSCENQHANKSSKRKAEEGDSLVISSYDDLKHFGEKLNDVLETLKLAGQQLISLAESMASHKRNKVAQIDTNLTPHNPCNVDEVARKDDAKMVTFKVNCFARPAVKFPLRLKCNVAELEENIRSRIKLGPEKLTMLYKDEDLQDILITSDADFQFGLETLTSKGWTTIRIQCYHKDAMLKI